MSKVISIKLTEGGFNIGPFTVSDQFGGIIAENVSKNSLVRGMSYVVEDYVTMITLQSTGACTASKTNNLSDITRYEYAQTDFVETNTTCMWRHLTNPTIYNYFYGKIEPYIIEYPFAYQYFDEILQNVKDYTKAYKYFGNAFGTFDNNAKVETDRVWFNEAVIYNDRQSSGLLTLVPKPLNNMKEYLSFPKYNSDSKTITYTKSDNFYQYNTFWDIVKDKTQPLFIQTCESLSIDKIINQVNMDYGLRSFKKSTFRAKDLKIRHMLTNNSSVHLVSQFIYGVTQNSYK